MTAPRQCFMRWLKFITVGAIGICLQLSVLALLRSGFGLNYLFSTPVAVEITVVHNFLWHERFTWADRMTSTPSRRFVAFNLSSGAISLLGNIGLMKLLVGVFGVNYLVANVFSIAACSLLNFAVGDQFVFAPQCTDR